MIQGIKSLAFMEKIQKVKSRVIQHGQIATYRFITVSSDFGPNFTNFSSQLHQKCLTLDFPSYFEKQGLISCSATKAENETVTETDTEIEAETGLIVNFMPKMN